jgi:hypothetical protein
MKMRPMALFTAYSFLHLVRPFLAYDVQDISFPITPPSSSDGPASQEPPLTKSSQSQPGSPPRLGPSRRGRHCSHRRCGYPSRWAGLVAPCMGWKRLAPLHDHPTGRVHPLLSSPALCLARRAGPLSPTRSPALAGRLSPAR